MRNSILIFIFFSALSFPVKGQKALKAITSVHEEAYNKAFEYLQKGLERNPEDPANYFVLAKIYSAPQFASNAIDSAHFYIKLATIGFNKIESKKRRKYFRNGMDSTSIGSLHAQIDSIAFAQAKAINTSQAFNAYLLQYQGSTFLPDAKLLRNELAYAEALAQKTPEALSKFFKLYPEAPQAFEAREVFENLYYEQFVGAKNEAVYRAYMEERPHTIFAEKAAFALLDVLSTKADSSSLRQFSNRYSSYKAAKVSYQFLQFLKTASYNEERLSHYKNRNHYFFNFDTKQLEGLKLGTVATDSCKWIHEPVLKIQQKDGKLILNFSGDTVFYGSPRLVEVIEGNWVKIKSEGSYLYDLIHLSKQEPLQKKALDFKAVDDFYYAEKQVDGWYLNSFTGVQLIPHAVDSIWKWESIYFFKKDNKMAISDKEKLGQVVLNKPEALAFLYTDYRVLNDSILWLATDNYEMLVDHSFNEKIGLQKGEIEQNGQYYLLKREENTLIYDAKFKPLFEVAFDKVVIKSKYLALKKREQWYVRNIENNEKPSFNYDSVRVFNSWLAYASDSTQQYLLFYNHATISLNQSDGFQLLNAHSAALPLVDEIRYVIVSNEKGFQKLYNGFGALIWEGQMAEIRAISNDLVYIRQEKSQILVNQNGVKTNLEKVDAIGHFADGLIPLLFKGKFGAFITSNKRFISPQSDNRLNVFKKDSIFVFQHAGKLGLLNSENIILPAAYQVIKAVNDSLAFVKFDDQWQLLHIGHAEQAIAAFNDVSFPIEGDEKLFKVRAEAGFGLIDESGQFIIPAIFNSLEFIRLQAGVFWVAERNLSEIDFKVLVYYDEDGVLLFKEGLTAQEFEINNCD